MNLNAVIHGSSFADAMAKAELTCLTFYGDQPYQVRAAQYDYAQAVEFDPETGAGTVFMVTINASLAPVAG